MKFSTLCSSALSLTLVPLASAVTIVNWGGDVVPSPVSMASGSDSTGALSLSTLANPTVGASYYPDATGATPEFYAASQADRANRFGVADSGSSDYISSVINPGSSLDSIFIWTKSYFINGASSASSVELESISVRVGDNGSGVTTISRMVIQLGSDFYISTAGAEGTTDMIDPQNATWYHYDPETDYTAIDESGGNIASLTAADFQDLTAVGAYASSSTAGTSLVSRFYSINVDATVIPEPSTFALVAALGAVTWIAIRRRR